MATKGCAQTSLAKMARWCLFHGRHFGPTNAHTQINKHLQALCRCSSSNNEPACHSTFCQRGLEKGLSTRPLTRNHSLIQGPAVLPVPKTMLCRENLEDVTPIALEIEDLFAVLVLQDDVELVPWAGRVPMASTPRHRHVLRANSCQILVARGLSLLNQLQVMDDFREIVQPLGVLFSHIFVALCDKCQQVLHNGISSRQFSG